MHAHSNSYDLISILRLSGRMTIHDQCGHWLLFWPTGTPSDYTSSGILLPQAGPWRDSSRLLMFILFPSDPMDLTLCGVIRYGHPFHSAWSFAYLPSDPSSQLCMVGYILPTLLSHCHCQMALGEVWPAGGTGEDWGKAGWVSLLGLPKQNTIHQVLSLEIWNQGFGRPSLPLKALGKGPSWPFLASGGSSCLQCSLACSCIPPMSTSIFTWRSPFVSVFSSLL